MIDQGLIRSMWCYSRFLGTALSVTNTIPFFIGFLNRVQANHKKEDLQFHLFIGNRIDDLDISSNQKPLVSFTTRSDLTALSRLYPISISV
jgi:hypothetical protein